ncbi:AAA family ATPase [Methylobacterium sp. WL30]|uniref:ATP-binding protein n=1 Tax=unclassified Methylobacterium TaxID=2615210 RepID=UPI0011CB8A16|nr:MULTISPECIES: ATP-binding protein [unclassified Methylobacterium]TXN34201.1 AAA family ATPase [Methylobacterium sp. WL93]TXN45348.1 AAA family ATPase [Methylobacterium sp. WL119]TXN63512.1 AAA family ATPase [Methylobacterium sp. WL30]
MTGHTTSPGTDVTAEDDAYFRSVLGGMPDGSRRVIEGLESVRSVYVDCARDKALLNGFNRFLERVLARRAEKRDEAEIFFLAGASGAGKSAAIGRMLQNHAALRPEQTSYGHVHRYVSIKLKGYTHPRLVGRQIIREAGYGMGHQMGRGEVWDEMAGHLRSQRVFLVHIDEAQHLLKRNASHQEREDLANAIKAVSIDTHWPVGFVLSGLPDVIKIAGGDEQIERRGNFVTFADVQIPDERDLVVDIIARMAKPVGVATGHLDETDLPERLARAASFRYGRICQIVEGALQEALHWDRKKLTVGHFSAAYERRSHAAGKEMRNPFEYEFWHQLKPGSFPCAPREPVKTT